MTSGTRQRGVGVDRVGFVARRVSSSIFVGRRAELERLGADLADAASGHSVLVVLGGEAGVGKTRLAAEISRRASADGMRVLRGGAVPVGGWSLPYAPLVELLRRLDDAAGSEPGEAIERTRAELIRLLPDSTAGMPAPAMPPGGRRRLILELLLRLVRQLASERPLLLQIEDLHWADRATLDQLAFLVHNLAAEPILVLVTFRSDEIHRGHPLLPYLAEFGRAQRVERLELARFDRTDLGALVTAIIGRDPEAELIESVYRRSDGNPYYAEELLVLADPSRDLPTGVADILGARLASASRATRALIGAASVAAGPLVDPGHLCHICRLDEAGLASALCEAASHGILIPDEAGEDRIRFRHPLLREAAEAELLPGERRRLHGAWAQTLEGDAAAGHNATTSAALAYHYRLAHDLPRALRASIAGGLAARALDAFADAATSFEQALELWDDVPDAESLAGLDLPGLLVLAAEVVALTGRSSLGAAYLRRAIAFVDPTLDPLRAGMLQGQLASLTWRAADPEAAIAASREAVRLVPAHPPSAARAQALEGLARHLVLAGCPDEALPIAQESASISRAVVSQATEAHALVTIGLIHAANGDTRAAAAAIRLGRDLAETAHDLDAASRAWSDLVTILEGAACVAEAEAAVAWEERHGLGAALPTRCLAALALVDLGWWQQADEMLARVRAGGPERGIEALAMVAQGRLDLERGLVDAAAASLDASWEQAQADPSGHTAVLAGHLRAQIHLARGALEEARSAAASAIERLSSLPVGTARRSAAVLATALRVEADIALRDRRRRRRSAADQGSAAAADMLERARTLVRNVGESDADTPRQPVLVALLCEGEWSRMQGSSEPDVWAAAAEACESAGQLHRRPYALLRLAEALLVRRRDRTTAAALLAEADDAAAAMGAEPLRVLIEASALRAGLSLRSPTSHEPSAPDLDARLDRVRLTRRERQVLSPVAYGRSNREIADELFITEKTAALHVSNILGKLDVPSRTAAAALSHSLAERSARPGRPLLVRGGGTHPQQAQVPTNEGAVRRSGGRRHPSDDLNAEPGMS